MTEKRDSCAVCGGHEVHSGRLSQVVVEGRVLDLCRSHGAMVAASMPATFDELRALFVGEGAQTAPPGRVERRSPIARRLPDDRRVFPPRPEGRRRSFGRRATDPQE